MERNPVWTPVHMGLGGMSLDAEPYMDTCPGAVVHLVDGILVRMCLSDAAVPRVTGRIILNVKFMSLLDKGRTLVAHSDGFFTWWQPLGQPHVRSVMEAQEITQHQPSPPAGLLDGTLGGASPTTAPSPPPSTAEDAVPPFSTLAAASAARDAAAGSTATYRSIIAGRGLAPLPFGGSVRGALGACCTPASVGDCDGSCKVRDAVLGNTDQLEALNAGGCAIEQGWLCLNSCVTTTLSARLGFVVDLYAIYAACLERQKAFVGATKRAFPSYFVGLSYRGSGIGQPVSRRNLSSRFPNQMSISWRVGTADPRLGRRMSNLHFMLFKDGAITITGARRWYHVMYALDGLLSLPGVVPAGVPRPPLPQPEISMHKRAYRLGLDLRLADLATLANTMYRSDFYAVRAEYGITRYTGAKIYIVDRTMHEKVCGKAGRCAKHCQMSVGAFSNGQVMVSGRSLADVETGFTVFLDVVSTFFEEVIQHNFDDVFESDASGIEEIEDSDDEDDA